MILELPKFDTTLPVAAAWAPNDLASGPCCYTGSIYDGSIIIGGSDNAGQFDFMKLISNGDSLFLTDMTGGRYRYTVVDIRKTTDVSTSALSALAADLTLFARNTYALDYTVVHCQLG